MSENKEKGFEIANLFIGIIAILLSIVFFVFTNKQAITIQTLVIFGIIALVLIFLSFITDIISRWNKINKNVDENKRDITDIKKSLYFKDLFNGMDVRLKVIEKMFDKNNKKAQAIDPRIIGWILLLLLLYLLLKSVGFFK
jgi:hypothetical protein